jgi:hypothetical protein
MHQTFQHLRILFVCLLMASVLAGCITTYNHRTPEKLGKTVLKILKNQDQAGLDIIVPTEADLESFLATADMPEEELAAFREEMKQIIAEFTNAAHMAFQATSDAASREGIVLSKVKLVDIHVKTWQGPDNELGNIDLDLMYGGKKYVLKIKEAGKVASGWVIGLEGFELVGAGE